MLFPAILERVSFGMVHWASTWLASLLLTRITGNVTKVEFGHDNTLSVAAADGDAASIFKKDFSVVVIGIPEPGAITLLFAGLPGLVGFPPREVKASPTRRPGIFRFPISRLEKRDR